MIRLSSGNLIIFESISFYLARSHPFPWRHLIFLHQMWLFPIPLWTFLFHEWIDSIIVESINDLHSAREGDKKWLLRIFLISRPNFVVGILHGEDEDSVQLGTPGEYWIWIGVHLSMKVIFAQSSPLELCTWRVSKYQRPVKSPSPTSAINSRTWQAIEMESRQDDLLSEVRRCVLLSSSIKIWMPSASFGVPLMGWGWLRNPGLIEFPQSHYFVTFPEWRPEAIIFKSV